MAIEPRSVSLYLSEGSSDKEYHVQLESAADGSGWLVNFQYGRRGKPLRSGSKTASALGFDQASEVYDNLVSEKMAKGYTPDVSGAVFQDTVVGENFTGFLPMLPQTVRRESDIEAMMESPQFVAQEKFDGENRQVRVIDSVVSGINKRGMLVPLPRDMADVIRNLGVDLLISAEQVGNTLHVFDIQEWDGKDLRDRPYIQRLEALEFMAAAIRAQGASNVVVVPTAQSKKNKQALVEEIRQRQGEGVVFKDINASFVSGKLSASASSTFKWKFTEDCTVRVASLSKTKRSVAVEIDHQGQPLPMGSVTVSSNHDMPKVGDLVSVTYLYLYEGGSLFQPQYKGVRTDCDGTDPLDSFKIKAKEPAPSWVKPPRR